MLHPIARRALPVLTAVVAGALFAGCGSGGSYDAGSTATTTIYASGPTTAPTFAANPDPTRPNASGTGSLYLSIIGPTNQATVAFDTTLAKLGNDPTTAQLQNIAAPLANALDTARASLLAATWPTHAAADVTKLAHAVDVMVGQLRSQIGNPRQWIDTVRTDETNIVDAARVVRSDLGV
jgi:hypothetical protein